MDENSVWQCECGYVEHTPDPPGDCQKCLRLNKFSLVPEDRIEEAEAEAILASHVGGDEDEE